MKVPIPTLRAREPVGKTRCNQCRGTGTRRRKWGRKRHLLSMCKTCDGTGWRRL